ncbi:MAG: hypothetical protein IKU29_05370 [Parabacteroides sp.]|nr:hypothetical protein [Parabacteroides sp.]
MENFQLYRTNVLLGGQCKWDLILDGVGEGLKISDIHLTPIDKNLPYNYYSEESLLNYPHSENIKRFYKQTEGNFYSCKPLTRLDNDWLILDENDGQVVYDDTYETGVKNSNYQLYSKSLEYLCPVWIEVLKNSDEFIAKLEVWTDSKCIGYKEVNLLEGRFGMYFSNYIEYLDLNTGSDELIKVDLLGKKAYVRGIRVDTGAVLDIDVSDLTYNLLNRERTLLENDAMLINNYPNNRLIAKQLFNFNFCFNLSDLISKKLENELIGEELRFNVSFLINGKELEMRDFYSNYEYLPIANIGMIQKDIQTHQNSPNALDYLLDNLYISHITKNKYLQNTCHWSLSSNSQYMFNLYNGLGSYMDNGDGVVKFGHR